MASTVSLSSTTLAQPISATADLIKVSSTTGILPGLRLFVDGELMSVVSLQVDPWIKVLRGRDGTASAAHLETSQVWIGRGDQFFDQDPTGLPPAATPVSPYINVRNGSVWFTQGDDVPSGQSLRWWQKQTTTYDQSSLGVRTVTPSPTSGA